LSILQTLLYTLHGFLMFCRDFPISARGFSHIAEAISVFAKDFPC
jgi:hypothetical protein